MEDDNGNDDDGDGGQTQRRRRRRVTHATRGIIDNPVCLPGEKRRLVKVVLRDPHTPTRDAKARTHTHARVSHARSWKCFDPMWMCVCVLYALSCAMQSSRKVVNERWRIYLPFVYVRAYDTWIFGWLSSAHRPRTYIVTRYTSVSYPNKVFTIYYVNYLLKGHAGRMEGGEKR